MGKVKLDVALNLDEAAEQVRRVIESLERFESDLRGIGTKDGPPKREDAPEPSWDDAPEWAEWLARGRDASAVHSEFRPFYMESAPCGWGVTHGRMTIVYHNGIRPVHLKDWHDTLERRPLTCECGAEAKIFDTKSGAWGAYCPICGPAITGFDTEDAARAAWRRLMG